MTDRDAILSLEREKRAAEALRNTLAKMPEIDESTLRDTIEGETGLHEAIREVVATLTYTEAMWLGLRAKITEFEERALRYAARIDYLRSAIEQAMVIGELKTLELPDCTLTIARRAPGLVIVDESRIPSQFWVQPPPKLDKAAVKAALNNNLDIPGAALGNGSVSITIRRA